MKTDPVATPNPFANITQEQADSLLGNCTTTLPFAFELGDADHTVVIGPTSKGMSGLSDALLEQYRGHGGKPVVKGLSR